MRIDPMYVDRFVKDKQDAGRSSECRNIFPQQKNACIWWWDLVNLFLGTSSFTHRHRYIRPKRGIAVVLFLVACLATLPISQALESQIAITDAPLDQQVVNSAESNKDERVLKFLQSVVSGASLPWTERTSDKRKRDSHERGRFRSIRSSLAKLASTVMSYPAVATVAVTATVANVAMAIASVESEVDKHSLALPENPENRPWLQSAKDEQTRKKRKRQTRMQTEQKINPREEEDAEIVEGARLISASFGLLSNTFGLLADGVRVSGDTAAGIMGSSVKLVGTAVKSVSYNFDNAGRVLEPKEIPFERRKILTSERLMGRQQRKHNEDMDPRHDGLLRNTRNVAAQSVRLVGSVIRGFGDSLLLAGAATESIASSTTGVAEDAVRLLEDFAGTISVAITASGRGQRRRPKRVKVVPVSPLDSDDDADLSFVSFGSYTDPSSPENFPDGAAGSFHRRHTSEGGTKGTWDISIQQMQDFLFFILAETQGVPSFSMELLGVMILCYFASFLALSRSERGTRHDHSIQVPMLTEVDEASSSSHEGDDDNSQRVPPIHKVSIANRRAVDRKLPIFIWSILRLLVAVVILPLKTIRFILFFLVSTIFNRKTMLLVVYTFGWIYLCRSSQLRSLSIQRNAEASGFSSAIASIGNTSPSVVETVVWLNALLGQLWRVPYDPRSPDSMRWVSTKLGLPKFVRRAIRSATLGRPECVSCDWKGLNDVYGSPACFPYGGLEPYISGKIGTSVLHVFEASKVSRTNDVAYVSLYSFTLGKRPPIIRSIELLGMRASGQKLHFNIDVDALLEDLSLVLEVKLSSLDYALLPSTKVSIHAIDTTLPLQVSVSVTPEYPFVSILEFSLANAPECNVRITPLSGDSGLRGVDLGSLPIIREWVQDVIRETLSEYVTPKYIAFDLGAWLTSAVKGPPLDGSSQHPRPNLSHLRQKTKMPVNPNPRTLSSRVVKITSVADSLPSHRSATKTAFARDNESAFAMSGDRTRAPSLVKPTTELSRLGMDRWISKLSEQEVAEHHAGGGLAGMFAKPLAVISPFLIAIAAGVFRDRIVDDDEASH